MSRTGRPQIHTRGQLVAALRRHGGNVTHAAADLGITQSGFWRRIQRDPTLRDEIEQARNEPRNVVACDTCGGTGVVSRAS